MQKQQVIIMSKKTFSEQYLAAEENLKKQVNEKQKKFWTEILAKIKYKWEKESPEEAKAFFKARNKKRRLVVNAKTGEVKEKKKLPKIKSAKAKDKKKVVKKVNKKELLAKGRIRSFKKKFIYQAIGVVFGLVKWDTRIQTLTVSFEGMTYPLAPVFLKETGYQTLKKEILNGKSEAIKHLLVFPMTTKTPAGMLISLGVIAHQYEPIIFRTRTIKGRETLKQNEFILKGDWVKPYGFDTPVIRVKRNKMQNNRIKEWFANATKDEKEKFCKPLLLPIINPEDGEGNIPIKPASGDKYLKLGTIAELAGGGFINKRFIAQPVTTAVKSLTAE